MRYWALVAVALAVSGCGVKTGADAIVWDGEVLMCRTVETEETSWFICRTHPTVTPEILAAARELHDREGVSLPVAIGRLVSWKNYGL